VSRLLRVARCAVPAASNFRQPGAARAAGPGKARVTGRGKARRGLAAAALLAVGLAVAGCDGGAIAADTPQSDGQSFVSGAYQSTYFKPGDRPKAPVISGTTLTGQRLSLASYRGDVVVLNFWGSWCAPCRAEAPSFGTLARQLYPSGVRFVGVDIRDEPDSALAYMQTFRIGYPSLNDPDDEIALEFRNTVPPSAIPTTVIIDRAGRIAASIVGGATYNELRALVTEVATGHP
jgi:thiol-disulfide isomerase/thioredoxin